MHCVRILYPKKPGSSFDWDHYYAVHLPLGLGLLAEHCGITPARVEVDQQMSSDGKGGPSPYHCICSVYFTDKQQADAMVALFGIEEARRLLSEDWPKYTELAPELLVCEVIEADPASGKRS